MLGMHNLNQPCFYLFYSAGTTVQFQGIEPSDPDILSTVDSNMPSNPSSVGAGSDGLSPGAIAGLIIGLLILGVALLITVIVVAYWTRERRTKRMYSTDMELAVGMCLQEIKLISITDSWGSSYLSHCSVKLILLYVLT